MGITFTDSGIKWQQFSYIKIFENVAFETSVI